MNIWDKITGNDITREWKSFESRAKKLPADYQVAWKQISANLFPYGDFTGRNLTPILDNVLGLLEETASDGLSIQEVLGEDIKGFSTALAGAEGVKSYRDKWREELNNNIAKKIKQKREDQMSIQDIIRGKREWRAHMARVKALPQDYQIVYKEIQKYLFKVSPIELTEGTSVISKILDLFEESASLKKEVLEVTGSDVASFCDDLIKDSKTYSEVYQECIKKEVDKI